MKTYNIPVFWMVSATVQVEAKSLDEAMELALEAKLPIDGEYMDNSFQVDDHHAEEMNQA